MNPGQSGTGHQDWLLAIEAFEVAHHFPYLTWLQKSWRDYSQATVRPAWRGRVLTLTPQQFGAALLMTYLGRFSLGELSAVAGVDLAQLEKWRGLPEFLLVMDWSKARFANHFQESLILDDFSRSAYQKIAVEFACLEESLRIRVRTTLYPQLRNLGERLSSQDRHGLSLETSSFPLFRRLFLFFWALEAFWPSPARPQLRERLLPLARELVWPTLGLGQGEELSEKLWGRPELLAGFKKILATEIRAAFTHELLNCFEAAYE
jgi:hypothetical protein